MDRKSYYKDGVYIDTTTGNKYIPLEYCEICGKSWEQLDIHHYLPQGKCKRDLKSKVIYPKTWTKEFIEENQKLFTLCRECHTKVHNCNSKKTEINGKRLYDFMWHEEKTEVVTKPKAFIVKRNKNEENKH